VPASAEPPTDQLGPTDIAKALVYGLVGVGASIVSGAPKAVKRARSDLVAARFIGEMAVTQGAAQLRSRRGTPAPGTGAPDSSAPSDDESATESIEPVEAEIDAGVDRTATDAAGTDAPKAAELAIPDYDTVPAIDVVMQLADLDVDERSRIEVYELANRQRRTILGKIDQLRGAE